MRVRLCRARAGRRRQRGRDFPRMKRVPVTLQISLAPSDHRLAGELLPHQIRTWRSQVEEVLLTVDLHRSRGRFADDWEAGRDRIMALIHSIPEARVLTVDDS